MIGDIPKYPKPKAHEDPVARSMAKPDACAKSCSMGKGVRVRVNMSDKSLKIKRRKRWPKDKRDVQFW